MTICEIDGCGNRMNARGWCAKHYQRWMRHGDPLRDRPTFLDRLPGSIEVTPFGCWSWLGFKDRKGYGRAYSTACRTQQAHRVTYIELVGPIPDGLHLDHLCRNHACVNPDHLEPVTCRENIIRGEGFAAKNVVKTKCTHGHEFTLENTYITTEGRRQCRKCRAANSARYYARERAS